MSRILAETMRSIGLSDDDIFSLYSNESRGWIYKGEVYSENMHRKVYLSYWEENNGASVHIIDRISLTDRDIMARAN